MTKSRTGTRGPTPHSKHYDDDDDGISRQPSRGKSSSSSPGSASPDELIDQLTRLGFDGAAAFVIRYGADRVAQAVARATSRPPGTIRNLPGYIRSLVTTRSPIPRPDKRPKKPKPFNRYTNGKLGHLVKH